MSYPSYSLSDKEIENFLDQVYQELMTIVNEMSEQDRRDLGPEKPSFLADPKSRILAAEYAIKLMDESGRLNALSARGNIKDDDTKKEFTEFLGAGAALALKSKQHVEFQTKELYKLLDEIDKLQVELEKLKNKPDTDPQKALKLEQLEKAIKKAEALIGKIVLFDRDPNQKRLTKENARKIAEALPKLKRELNKEPDKGKESDADKKDKLTAKPTPDKDTLKDKDKDKQKEKELAAKNKNKKSERVKDLVKELNNLMNGLGLVTVAANNYSGMIINGENRPGTVLEAESGNVASSVEGDTLSNKLGEEEGTIASFEAEEEYANTHMDIGMPESDANPDPLATLSSALSETDDLPNAPGGPSNETASVTDTAALSESFGLQSEIEKSYENVAHSPDLNFDTTPRLTMPKGGAAPAA